MNLFLLNLSEKNMNFKYYGKAIIYTYRQSTEHFS